MMMPPRLRSRSWRAIDLRRLEVGLEDGVVEVAAADEAAGVDVDRGQRLGLVDDQVAAGLQRRRGAPAPARSRPRRRAGRTAAARRCSASMRSAQRWACTRGRTPACAAKVSRESTSMRVGVVVDEVAQHAQRQGQVLVEQRRRRRRARLLV